MVFVIVAVVVEGGGEYAGRTAVGASARCWDGGRARAEAWIPRGGRALRAQGCGDGFGAADWGRGWKRLRPGMERRRIAGAARGVLAAGRTGTMCTPTLRTYRVVETSSKKRRNKVRFLNFCSSISILLIKKVRVVCRSALPVFCRSALSRSARRKKIKLCCLGIEP
jgi:hypothetical protein